MKLARERERERETIKRGRCLASFFSSSHFLHEHKGKKIRKEREKGIEREEKRRKKEAK